MYDEPAPRPLIHSCTWARDAHAVFDLLPLCLCEFVFLNRAEVSNHGCNASSRRWWIAYRGAIPGRASFECVQELEILHRRPELFAECGQCNGQHLYKCAARDRTCLSEVLTLFGCLDAVQLVGNLREPMISAQASRH